LVGVHDLRVAIRDEILRHVDVSVITTVADRPAEEFFSSGTCEADQTKMLDRGSRVRSNLPRKKCGDPCSMVADITGMPSWTAATTCPDS
jgi:hypothetical protein